MSFFISINKCFFKLVILFLIFDYVDFYVLKFLSFEFFDVLFNLYDKGLVNVDYLILLKKVEDIVKEF